MTKRIKWDVTRIGYAEGCTGHIFEIDAVLLAEAILNRRTKECTLYIWNTSLDETVAELPFKNMETLEKHINDNYLKINEDSP